MNIEKLKQQAENYQKSPDKEAWTRLNIKLAENSVEKQSFFFSKTFRYAASFLLVAASVTVLYFTNRNTAIPQPIFEQSFTESEADGIYSAEKIIDLQMAYRKIHGSDPANREEI